MVLRWCASVQFSNAQRGFTAVRREVAPELLPLVADTGWFFDTELLVLTERAGLVVHQVPVRWVQGPDSRVRIAATAWEDVKGIVRLARAGLGGPSPGGRPRPRRRTSHEPVTTEAPRGLPGQGARFAAIGVLSTAAYALVSAGLRDPLGAQEANLFFLLVTALANTATNRALRFDVRGHGGALAAQGAGLVPLGLALALTSGALAALHAVLAAPPAAMELTVLLVASAAATALRFVALRQWFARSDGPPQTTLYPPSMVMVWPMT